MAFVVFLPCNGRLRAGCSLQFVFLSYCFYDDMCRPVVAGSRLSCGECHGYRELALDVVRTLSVGSRGGGWLDGRHSLTSGSSRTRSDSATPASAGDTSHRVCEWCLSAGAGRCFGRCAGEVHCSCSACSSGRCDQGCASSAVSQVARSVSRSRKTSRSSAAS